MRMEESTVYAEIDKYCNRHERIDMIYMRADGTMTKRRIQPIAVRGDVFTAWCFLRRERRTFKVERVLAVRPIITRETALI